MDEDYEDLTDCGLTPELEKELIHTQRECTFMWTNKKGEAFGVIMSFLPKDGKLWLTAAERRARISALRRFPRASVCINSTGSSMGGGCGLLGVDQLRAVGFNCLFQQIYIADDDCEKVVEVVGYPAR